jgi:hypothetical protein
MKNLLLLLFVVGFTATNAQTGNLLSEAIPINGSNVNVNILNFTSASASSTPFSCSGLFNQDVYYKHVINPGANKLTIGMFSLGLTVFSKFDYQILKAPGGDLSNLEEVSCDHYDVVVLVGGSFELILDDFEVNDQFYLRVNTPQGLLASLLSSLLSTTTITMYSEFDATLSVASQDVNDHKIINKSNQLQLLTNKDFKSYKIYSLDGKQVKTVNSLEQLETIDISTLNKGVYVLLLEDNTSTYHHKFIKS